VPGRVVRLFRIREEGPDDAESIRRLNRLAFGGDLEGDIVDALRSNQAALLSLVATVSDRVVGHVLYSPVTVGGRATGAALGPMAVLPEWQRQGIGSRLVETGNRKIKGRGLPFVLVGHANFCPRFGFAPARARGIQCEWDVPDDAFLLLVLDEEKMRGVSGPTRYRHEFSSAS
jgi:putative acetyltransferase